MSMILRRCIVLGIFLCNIITGNIETYGREFCLISNFRSQGGAECLKCYRCTSTDALKDPYQCNEFFDDSELEPESCDDVYNAQYCIKQIGRFEGSGIECFQCDSAWDISCTDLLISDGTLQPQSCDRIYDAQYCIKMTGGLGTKRFCSSADFGNYCNYMQQLGDQMEYRSCYFTCTGDGCNSAFSTKPFQYLTVLLTSFLIYYQT